MKRIYNTLIFLFIISTGSNLVAQTSIQFVKGGYIEALQQSKLQNKPVFFMCFASWCPHCKKMKSSVFTDSLVAQYYNEHFICAEQDMELDEGIALHDKFKIKSYPTFIFMDSAGTVLYRTTGEFKAPAFIGEGKNAQTTKKQLPYLKKQFEKDTSNAGSCYEYLRALKKGGMDYTDVVKKYFSTQTDKQLISEVNFRIISNGITDIDSREFQYLVQHQKEFASATSNDRVEKKIFFLVKELLNSLVDASDTINYFINRPKASAIHLAKIDSLIFTCDNKIYAQTNNWVAYKNTTMQSTEMYAWKDYNQLKEIAIIYIKHIDDNAALIQAVKWLDQSLILNEEYSTYLLSAQLYQKLKDKSHAIEMAIKGKELAVKYGWDFSEADKLLKGLK
jgi:thioredoxin-related protein